MKEKKLNNKSIINTLEKKGFIEICPICNNCATEVFMLVNQYFTNAHFNMTQIGDELFSLKINV